MNYRKFIKYIKSYGFHFYRSCKSSHDLYINEDMQKEMINIVTTKVLKRITPAIKTNIKLIYNINNNEDLINVIGTIVSMQVLSYCIETNVVREE